MSAAYTYYAANAFRYYFRQNKRPEKFASTAFQTNWEVCEKVVQDCDQQMLEIVREVYISCDTTGDAVYEASKKFNIHQDNIWTMLAVMEKRFARERGLI